MSINSFYPVSSKQRVTFINAESKRATCWSVNGQKHSEEYTIRLHTPSAEDIMENHSIRAKLNSNEGDLIKDARRYLKRPDLKLQFAMYGYLINEHDKLKE